MVNLMRNALGRRGHEATYARGAMRVDDGKELGLHNLAALLTTLPFVQWQHVIDEQVGSLLRALEHTPDGPVEPRDVFVRMHLRECLPFEVDYPVLEPLPGVLANLAIDGASNVIELFSDPERHGIASVATGYLNARANIRALPLPKHLLIKPDQRDPSSFVHVFIADDFFGASRVIELPDLLHRTLRASIPPAGALVAVPNRHMLAVHLMTGPSVVAASKALAQFALEECEPRPGPVSPHVYHLTPALTATQFTRRGDDGVWRLEVQGRVADAFRQLGVTE